MAELESDVHTLLLGLLRPVLPGTVGTALGRPAAGVPVTLARRSGGAALDGRLLADDAVVDVQNWATGDHEARDLAKLARRTIANAWRAQTVGAGGGSIARFTEQAAPALLDDETVPHGVYRYQATYELLVRPHRF